MNRVISKITLCFLLCICVWLAGLLWFINEIPVHPASDDSHTDAIIVLTGGSHRLEHGLYLLAHGKAKKLFISGVHDKSDMESILRHTMAPEIRMKLLFNRDSAQTIILGHEAENTIGNAEETRQWLQQEGYHTIRLVTSNYHMPRSLSEFRNTMPDITILPHPVFPDDFQLSSWWNHAESRRLILSEYHKLLAGKIRHWIMTAVQ